MPFTSGAPVDSEEMVTTPAGLRPASGVFPVPDGGSINISGNDVQVLDASKNIVRVAQHNSANLKSAIGPQESGWIADANWYNTGSPISYFSTSWVVPPAPVTYHGQTIYLFNSIEPASGNAILQPVLQYGPSPAGGGEYWTVATWYLDPSGTYFTPLVNVSVGQVLQGIIELTSISGSVFSYSSGFTNIPGQMVVNNASELVWATETLESYSVTAGTDYPQGSTTFYDINLVTTTGTPAVSWAVSDDTADGIYATVAQDGATNAVIVINYET